MVKESIGIEAEKPKSECNDSKCPWHGKLPVRGRVFTGEVVKHGSAKTVTVKWGFHQFLPKYERYERRNTTVSAYLPGCITVKKGDTVKIAECRPLSKTKSFVVVENKGVSR
jgi:small subunit ribosomal protein S17